MHARSELKRNENADIVTFVLPKDVPDRWREHVLHDQTARFLKLALLVYARFCRDSVPTHEVAGTIIKTDQN
jgi:hypothetical protein